MIKKISRIEIFLYISAVFVFIYIVLRAYFVPPLADEVETSEVYVFSGNFIPWVSYTDANNHILNSLLTWIFSGFFGRSLFILRLANTLSFLLYIVSVIGISRSFANQWKRALFVITLLFTQGFIEFFGYCRGYGLSMGLIVASVWMIFSFDRKPAVIKLIFALVLNVLSVSANLNLMPPAAIIFLFITLLWYIIPRLSENAKHLSLISADSSALEAVNPESLCSRDCSTEPPDASYFRKIKLIRHKHKRHCSVNANNAMVVSLIITTALFVILLKYSLYLQENGKFYYGSDVQQGFYESVLKTNIFMLFFSKSSLLSLVTAVIAVVTFILFTIRLMEKKFRDWLTPSVMLFPALFIGSVASILILHYVFGIRFPEDRTSIYLFPFLAGFVFFATEYIDIKAFRWIIVFFLFIPVHFIAKANLSYSFHWWYERYDESFVELVKKTSGDIAPGNVTICSYKNCQNAWSYFVRNKVTDVNMIDYTNKPNNLDDYQLLWLSDLGDDPSFYKDYKMLASDKVSGLTLFMRCPRMNRSLVFSHNVNVKPDGFSSEYFNFLNDTVINISRKSFVCDFIFSPDLSDDFNNCLLNVTIWDSLHNAIQYHALNLGHVSNQTKPEYNYSISIINIPDNAHSIVAYLHNPDKKKIILNKAVFRLSELKE